MSRRQGAGAPDPVSPDREPDPHEVARTIVLRQLTMAPRSRAQLAQALARRGCDPHVADTVLNRMEEVGLVDDVAYAGMLVRSQQASRGLASRALRVELRRKGVRIGEGAVIQPPCESIYKADHFFWVAGWVNDHPSKLKFNFCFDLSVLLILFAEP